MHKLCAFLCGILYHFSFLEKYIIITHIYMKKLYYFLGAALLLGASASAVVSTFPATMTLGYKGPYTISENVVDDDNWSFRKYAGTTICRSQDIRFQIWTGAENEIDAWYVSPAVGVTEGNEYTFRIRMSLHASSNKYASIAAYVSSTNPVADEEAAAAVKAGEASFTLTDYTGNDAQQTSNAYETVYTATETGKVYLAINFSGDCQGGVNLYDLTITEKAPVVVGPIEPEDPDHECIGKTVPYISNIVADANTFEEGWTTIDANSSPNSSAQQWLPSTDAGGSPGFSESAVAKYTWSSSIEADDYLISPAVHLVAGTEYKIQFGLHTQGSDKEDITVYATTDISSTDAIKAGTIVHDFVSFSDKAAKTYTDSFVPTKTGDYYFAIWAHSPKGKFNIYMRGFNVLENKFATSPVSDLTATVAPNRELKVTLNWTLPTTSAFGDPFTDEQTVEKVEIYRDGAEEVVATLDGPVETFDDTAETGLTSGKHTYTIRVFVAGTSADASVGPTAYAGPLAPTPVPVTFLTTNQDDYNMWSTVKGENDTNSDGWIFNTGSSAAYNYAKYNSQSGKVEDAWFFTPPFSVAEPGYYRFALDAEISAKTAPRKLEVHIGTTPSPEDMTLFNEALPLQYGTHNSGKPIIFDIYIAEAGTHYLGLHAAQPERSAVQNYYVYSCAIETSKPIPAPVKDLTIASKGDENVAVLTWTNSDVNFAGYPATNDYCIEIYIGEELVKTIEAADVVIGAQQTVEVPVEKAGSYTFTVKTVGPEEATAPEAVTVKSPWIGDRSVELPYTFNFANASSDDTYPLWDIVDANNDGYTWETSGYAGIVCQQRPVNSEGLVEYNDFLLSPDFNLEQGYYKFNFEQRGGDTSYKSNFSYRVGLVEVGNFDPENLTLLCEQSYNTKSSSYVYYDAIFNVENAGRYRVAIVMDQPAPSASYSYIQMTIRDLKFSALPVVPEVATELTVVPGEDARLEATFSWLNPTNTNVEGVTLAEGDITKAIVYRDGEEIATLTEGLVPGTTTTYVDTEVPQAGPHTYAVEIYNANGMSKDEAPSVKCPWIGGGLTAPYEFSGAAFDSWVITNLSGNTDYYGKVNTWKVNNNKGLLITSTSKAADDWAVSPIFEIEDGALYELEISGFHNTGWPSNDMKLEVNVGDAVGTLETMTKLHEFIIPTTAQYMNNAVSEKVYLQVGELDDTAEPVQINLLADGEGEGEEPATPTPAAQIAAGIYTFGIHAVTKGDIGVNKFGVKIIKKNVVGVEGPSMGSLAFADGMISFDGAADVKVYNIAGALVASAKAEGSYSLRDLANGVYIVRVTPENGPAATLKVVK